MFFRYIAGNHIKHALRKSQIILDYNKIPIINFCVETNYPQQNIIDEFKHITHYLPKHSKIALKLSLFDFKIDLLHPILEKLISKNCKILVDAENHNQYENYSKLTNELIYFYNKDQVNIYKTYQMYKTNSFDELEEDVIQSKIKNHYLGIKLVRGAYYQEDKTKKLFNQNFVLYQNKKDTDLNYNKAILYLFNHSLKKSIINATHNQESIHLSYLLNQEKKIFEFAHLMGMNEKKYDDLVKDKQIVNVYVPYGPYQYMIPYLTRRLYENLDTFYYMIK